MAAVRKPDKAYGLVQDVIAAASDEAGNAETLPRYHHFSALSRVDYRARLRQYFDRRQLFDLMTELRRRLPTLNRRVFAETDLARLASLASELGAKLQSSAFEGREGRTLRGFYINDKSVAKRPLIVVNTADDPVGVAAAFWHEMGHHLIHMIFGREPDALHPYFTTNYRDHLKKPEELLADLVMVLAAYPKATAERLFDVRDANRDMESADLVAKAIRHIRSVSRPAFPAGVPIEKRLYMFASMIHVAKLRGALLREYDI